MCSLAERRPRRIARRSPPRQARDLDGGCFAVVLAAVGFVVFKKHFQSITGIAGVYEDWLAGGFDSAAPSNTRRHRRQGRSDEGQDDRPGSGPPDQASGTPGHRTLVCPHLCGARVASLCREVPQPCMGYPRRHPGIPTYGYGTVSWNCAGHLCFSCWVIIGARDIDPELRPDPSADEGVGNRDRQPEQVARASLPRAFVARGTKRSRPASSASGTDRRVATARSSGSSGTGMQDVLPGWDYDDIEVVDGEVPTSEDPGAFLGCEFDEVELVDGEENMP